MKKEEESNSRGRKPKYLTIERFEEFLYNDFKHIKWEVNGLIFGAVIIIGLLVTILSALAGSLFGG